MLKTKSIMAMLIITIVSLLINPVFADDSDSILVIFDAPGTSGGTGWRDDGTIVRLATDTDSVGIGTTDPEAKLDVVGGDVKIATQGKGLILRDTDGDKCHRLTTNSVGVISSALVDCATGFGVPSAINNLVATSGLGEISLSWSAPYDGGTPITGYKIYRGNSTNPTALLTTIGALLTYLDNTVTGGTTYYYRVIAVNAVGDGPYSNNANTIPAGWLTNSTSWTQNNDTYRSSQFSAYNATYVVDGNTAGTTWADCTYHTNQWIKFDLGASRTISYFRIWNDGGGGYGAKNCRLETSSTLGGTYTSVLSFIPDNGAAGQVFSGFSATSQYWRFYMVDSWNAGGCLQVQEIGFGGY